MKESPLWWLRNCTKTFDQQWEIAGLPGAYNRFPDHSYLDVVFDFLERVPKLIHTNNPKVRIMPKGRALLLSWSVIGKLVHQAQTKEQQEIIIQSKTEVDGIYLIGYAKTLYRQQPEWLQREFPLARGFGIDDFPMDRIAWANGSFIEAIPQGAAKLNTRHPSIHFMDEGAFHEEGREAYNSSVAASAFIIVVSSAHPGWFHDLVGEDRYPRHAPQVQEGVAFTETPRGLPVLWLDCTAHQDRRTQEWADREEQNYTSKGEFLRQQHIDFTAGGGEKVLRERLEARWDEIVISDPDWRPHSEWSYVAGLDYGQTHRTAFEVIGRDPDGCLYAIQEHYQAGLTPGENAEIIRRMRLPCKDNPVTIEKIRWTYSDPSLFPENVAGEDRFTSEQILFERHGSLKMQKGLKGMDLLARDMLLEMWPKKGPIRFKIWCPEPVQKLTDGTYQHGCPNLLWELMNIKRKQISATVTEKRGDPEGLVDNLNDAWDGLKYVLTAGGPRAIVETREQRWGKRRAALLELNPSLDCDSMIQYRAQFELKEQRREKELSWK